MLEVERRERNAPTWSMLISRAGGSRIRACSRPFGSVPREAFLPAELAEFAYEDTPLPIGDEQTISQPYIVALTAEALGLRRRRARPRGRHRLGLRRRDPEPDREGGLHGRATSSRSRTTARERLARLGYTNVHVRLRRRLARLAGARALRRDRGRGGRPEGAAGAPGAARRRRSARHPGRSGRGLAAARAHHTRERRRSIGEENARARYASCRSSASRAGRGESERRSCLRAPRRAARARGRGRRALVREAAEPIDDIDTAPNRRAARAHRRRARRPPRRGDARHERVLSDARAHHA